MFVLLCVRIRLNGEVFSREFPISTKCPHLFIISFSLNIDTWSNESFSIVSSTRYRRSYLVNIALSAVKCGENTNLIQYSFIPWTFLSFILLKGELVYHFKGTHFLFFDPIVIGRITRFAHDAFKGNKINSLEPFHYIYMKYYLNWKVWSVHSFSC